MNQARKVYSYRNWQEAIIGVAFIGAAFLSVFQTSSALWGVPAMHPHQLKPIEFAFVGPCLWGFSAFLFYLSLRFWNEAIEVDGPSITWIGRWGRVRCKTQFARVQSLDEAFVLTGKGWIVHTVDGPIRFDCRMNNHEELLERFRIVAERP